MVFAYHNPSARLIASLTEAVKRARQGIGQKGAKKVGSGWRGRKGNACGRAQTFYQTPFVCERETMMYYH